jgi:hypothetical protein
LDSDLRRPLGEPPPEVRMIIEDAVCAYDVAVDHESLKTVSLGRKGPGYKIGLLGGVDGRWTDGFAAARSQSRDFLRFQLDGPDRAVSFALDSDAPPTETIDALQKLDDLVYQANVLASR